MGSQSTRSIFVHPPWKGFAYRQLISLDHFKAFNLSLKRQKSIDFTKKWFLSRQIAYLSCCRQPGSVLSTESRPSTRTSLSTGRLCCWKWLFHSSGSPENCMRSLSRRLKKRFSLKKLFLICQHLNPVTWYCRIGREIGSTLFESQIMKLLRALKFRVHKIVFKNCCQQKTYGYNGVTAMTIARSIGSRYRFCPAAWSPPCSWTWFVCSACTVSHHDVRFRFLLVDCSYVLKKKKYKQIRSIKLLWSFITIILNPLQNLRMHLKSGTAHWIASFRNSHFVRLFPFGS